MKQYLVDLTIDHNVFVYVKETEIYEENKYLILELKYWKLFEKWVRVIMITITITITLSLMDNQ